MSQLYLTPHEASNWQPEGTFVRILPEQPPKRFNGKHDFDKDGINFYHSGEFADICTIKLPFSVGDVVGCKETYVYDDINKVYHYKADYTEVQLSILRIIGGENNVLWHSSAIMPKPAIRRWLKIESVDIKRVQEITPQEADKLMCYSADNLGSIKRDFIDHFNSLYAKPQPVKEHGKIVSYVAHMYGDNADIMWYGKPFNLKATDTHWLGLPLTIHANPYIMLIVGKEAANATMDN